MKPSNSMHVLRVKVWRERVESTGEQTLSSEWRGEVHRLETGKTVYFRHLSGFEEGLKKIGICDEKIT